MSLGMPGELSAAADGTRLACTFRLSGDRKVARMGPKCKGSLADFQRFAVVSRPENRRWRLLEQTDFPGSFHMAVKTLPGAGEGTSGVSAEAAGYSCNCRFSDSTSSDSAVSLATSASILRTACKTVV